MHSIGHTQLHSGRHRSKTSLPIGHNRHNVESEDQEHQLTRILCKLRGHMLRRMFADVYLS